MIKKIFLYKIEVLTNTVELGVGILVKASPDGFPVLEVVGAELSNDALVGLNVGEDEVGGDVVGGNVGKRVGLLVVGCFVGLLVGRFVGRLVGLLVGRFVGRLEGFLVGFSVGYGVSVNIFFSPVSIQDGTIECLHPFEFSPGVGFGLDGKAAEFSESSIAPGVGFGVNIGIT